jgi:hypothetical protein
MLPPRFGFDCMSCVCLKFAWKRPSNGVANQSVCSNDVDTCFVAQCLRAWVSEISSGISHDEVFLKNVFWQAAESLGLTTSFLTVNVDMIAF